MPERVNVELSFGECCFQQDPHVTAPDWRPAVLRQRIAQRVEWAVWRKQGSRELKPIARRVDDLSHGSHARTDTGIAAILGAEAV